MYDEEDRSCLAQEAFDLSQTHGVHQALDAFSGLGEAELRLLDHERNNERFNEKWDDELLRMQRNRGGSKRLAYDEDLPPHIRIVHEQDLQASEGYWSFLEYLKGKRESAVMDVAGIEPLGDMSFITHNGEIHVLEETKPKERRSDVDDANTIHWTGLINHLERYYRTYTLYQARELNDIVKQARNLRSDNTRGIGWFHYTKLRMMLEYIIAKKSKNKYAVDNYKRYKDMFLKARARSYSYALINTLLEPDEYAGFDESLDYMDELPRVGATYGQIAWALAKCNGSVYEAAMLLGVHTSLIEEGIHVARYLGDYKEEIPSIKQPELPPVDLKRCSTHR